MPIKEIVDNGLVIIFFIVVFGFFNESFVGSEQGQGHTVKAGYQKGATLAQTNMVFNVIDIPGTASELTVSCLEQDLTKVSTDDRKWCWF